MWREPGSVRPVPFRTAGSRYWYLDSNEEVSPFRGSANADYQMSGQEPGFRKREERNGWGLQSIEYDIPIDLPTTHNLCLKPAKRHTFCIVGRVRYVWSMDLT